MDLFHGHSWLSWTKKIIAAWGVALLIGFVLVYLYASRYVADNVYLQHTRVEGLSRQAVATVAHEQISALAMRPVRLKGVNKTHDFTLADMGVSFDETATVDRVFDIGRALFLKADLASSGAPQKHIIRPISIVDSAAMRSVLSAALDYEIVAVQDASIAWSPEAGWHIREAVFGRRLAEGEQDRLEDAILKQIYEGDGRYAIKYETVAPAVTGEGLTGLLAAVIQAAGEPIAVELGTVSASIDFTAPGWLDIDYRNGTVTINPSEAVAFAADFAARFDVKPSVVTVKALQEFESEYTEGTYQKAVIEGEFTSGRLIDQARLAADIVAAFAAPAPRRVEVAFERVPAQVISEIPGMQFPDMISRGESDYSSGNKPNRVHNIKRALELQDLTVVDVGETFSYNKVLGWVTYEKGFVDGQVIFGNSLANVAGGGVCQTSTTFFRAVVNAGLPVTERKSHTWDVHYYQDWYGVDAAVYPPGKLDVGFVNDTPGPILIHSYIDTENENAYFEFYGTDDGRTVRTETVQNYRVGAGRKIVTDWEVTYPNGVVDKREIVSNYKR